MATRGQGTEKGGGVLIGGTDRNRSGVSCGSRRDPSLVEAGYFHQVDFFTIIIT